MMPKCVPKYALAFSLAVNIRRIEKADASFKGSFDEPRSVWPINSENRTQTVATKSKSFLNDV